MTRKILLIPSCVLLIGTIFSALISDSLSFWFWLFGFLFSCLIFLPIAFSFDDKKVPVFQIFFLLILFLIFFFRLAFWDFLAIGMKSNEALLYGMGTSVGILALIIMARGIKD